MENGRSYQRFSAHRGAALRKCADGIKFSTVRYVACMMEEGEEPQEKQEKSSVCHEHGKWGQGVKHKPGLAGLADPRST
jgi:hypothetical protein